MPSVTSTHEFAASPDKVWAIASDFSKYGEWSEAHVGFPDGAPTELVAGATFREKVSIMGMPGEATWTVAEISAPNSFKLSGQGPMGITLGAEVTLEDNGSGGSTGSMTASFEGGPLAGPLGDQIAKAAGTAGESSLAKLDALVSAS